MRIVTLTLLFLGLTVSMTGCARNQQKEVSSLKAQVAQMDAELRTQQEQNSALQAELQSSRGAAQPSATLQVPFTGATYRTPSGFELPANDIQRALKSAGYYTGPVDGKIGPDSREAIRNFQRDNGLSADGVCGRQTWNKLRTYIQSAGG